MSCKLDDIIRYLHDLAKLPLHHIMLLILNTAAACLALYEIFQVIKYRAHHHLRMSFLGFAGAFAATFIIPNLLTSFGFLETEILIYICALAYHIFHASCLDGLTELNLSPRTWTWFIRIVLACMTSLLLGYYLRAPLSTVVFAISNVIVISALALASYKLHYRKLPSTLPRGTTNVVMASSIPPFFLQLASIITISIAGALLSETTESIIRLDDAVTNILWQPIKLLCTIATILALGRALRRAESTT